MSLSQSAGAVLTAKHNAAPNAKGQGPSTVYTFAIGGKAPLPAFVDYNLGKLISGVKYDPAKIPAGADLFTSNCVMCHGVPGVDRGGNIPNLGYMHSALIENLDQIVFQGAAMSRGMPDFTGKLSLEDVEKIKAFIQGTADAIRPKK
jgi:quinohemoprotein ethanol dehydrogenase